MIQKLLIYLSVGTFAMLVPLLVIAKQYKIGWRKTVCIAICLTMTGTLGTQLWFLLENGYWEGRSFYGAVFVVPLLFLLISKIIHVSYGELMDLSAPAECVMLLIMKCGCMREGCCGGKVLCTTADGLEIIFPSQIVEAANAFLIAAVLMLMVRNPKNRGTLFPWYMVIYGTTRFILNLFRAEEAVFLLGMTAGNVWSILSVIVGLTWLILHKKLRKSYEE